MQEKEKGATTLAQVRGAVLLDVIITGIERGK